jgi:hypothetical protein
MLIGASTLLYLKSFLYKELHLAQQLISLTVKTSVNVNQTLSEEIKRISGVED